MRRWSIRPLPVAVLLSAIPLARLTAVALRAQAPTPPTVQLLHAR